MTIGKKEIIKQLAERVYGNIGAEEIRKCTQFCDAVEDVFTDAILNDDRIVWTGFMTVSVTKRKERNGRNPNTNEIVVFPPVKSINCKMSRSIRDLLNGKK